MTKQEVRDTIAPVIALFLVGESANLLLDEIVKAICRDFILLHQGPASEVPKLSPELDSTPEQSCVECGARDGFAMLRFSGGAVICLACLQGMKPHGAEARQFWENIVAAYSQGDRAHPKGCFGWADEALAQWLKRFGERPA